LASKFKIKLKKYQAISGSTINYRKSQIYDWNYTPREMFDITIILGIMGKTQWESIKYLGVLIFKASTKSSCWAPLIEKVKDRISFWGSSCLNPVGKLVLIKSVSQACQSTNAQSCSLQKESSQKFNPCCTTSFGKEGKKMTTSSHWSVGGKSLTLSVMVAFSSAICTPKIYP